MCNRLFLLERLTTQVSDYRYMLAVLYDLSILSDDSFICFSTNNRSLNRNTNICYYEKIVTLAFVVSQLK